MDFCSILICINETVAALNPNLRDNSFNRCVLKIQADLLPVAVTGADLDQAGGYKDYYQGNTASGTFLKEPG